LLRRARALTPGEFATKLASPLLLIVAETERLDATRRREDPAAELLMVSRLWRDDREAGGRIEL
jgi:hypothetical protein